MLKLTFQIRGASLFIIFRPVLVADLLEMVVFYLIWSIHACLSSSFALTASHLSKSPEDDLQMKITD